MAVVHAITIHHRGQAMLDECLRSLLASEGVDLHIVVVANACDEGLPGITTESLRIHLVRSETPIGFSQANNLGVGLARREIGQADYYYFVNNDTVTRPDSLALLVDRLERDQRAAVAGPKLLIQWAPEYLNSLGLNVTEDGWGWDEGIGIHEEDYGPVPGDLRVLAVTGSALLIAAGVYAALGDWTELYDYYFEEIDLCLRARAAGWEVVVEPEAVVLHRISATIGLDSERKLYFFWRNRLLLTLIHWPIGLLPRVAKRVLVDEILRQRWRDCWLQRKALVDVLRKLGPALAARRRRGKGSYRWVELLRPMGSVPVITLPPRDDGGPVLQEKEPPPSDEGEPTPLPGPRGNGSPLPRLLILGASPLPFEATGRSLGPGTRTWQITEPLVGDGHPVRLVGMRIPEAYPEDAPDEIVTEDQGFTYVSVAEKLYRSPGYVQRHYDQFRPEAVIFAHGAVSYLPAILEADVPVWVDLCGHVIGEGQAKAAVYRDDSFVEYFFQKIVTALFRGDMFSTVSEAQKCAVIGELGIAGRLNSHTDGHDLVQVIPCGVLEQDYEHRRTVLRGVHVAAEDFVVLSSGSFNTWSDVDTMFQGLIYAMDRDPSVHFVATGGQIDGHDELTYPRFVEMVNGSIHRDRFILKGWLPREEVPNYYFEADVGINCEKDIYEVRLGSKHRILDWSRAALPVVTTRITELSLLMEKEEIGFVFSPGDVEGLGEVILEACRRRGELAKIGQRFREILRRLYGFGETTRTLRKWAVKPGFAPDRTLDPLCLEAMTSTQHCVTRETLISLLLLELEAKRAEVQRLGHQLDYSEAHRKVLEQWRDDFERRPVVLLYRRLQGLTRKTNN